MNRTEGKAGKNLMLGYYSLLLLSGFGPPIGRKGREETEEKEGYIVYQKEEEYTTLTSSFPYSSLPPLALPKRRVVVKRSRLRQLSF